MGGRCDRCDSEAIFELAEGSISGGEKARLLQHIESCSECREIYDHEMSLSASLGSCFSSLVPSSSESKSSRSAASSVCRDVAMSIPTRSLKSRLAWAVLAAGLFVVAGVAMSLGGNSPFVAATGVTDGFWMFSSALADVSVMFLGLVAPIVLVAFLIGAVLDLAIAALVVAAIRYVPSSPKVRHPAETRRA